jgi:hypothetical protein
MRKTIAILFAVCFALICSPAGAQMPAAVQQVDTVNQRRQAEQTASSYETGESVPELFPGEDSDVGPQSVLKYKPRRTWFEATADAEYFYTDNMFLDHTNKQSADVLVSTAQFAVAPSPWKLAGGEFSPRIGFQQQWYDYGLLSDKRVAIFDFNSTPNLKTNKLNQFDFNAQTIFADGHWTRDNWTVAAGFAFRRLMTTEDYNQFYRESIPNWSLQRLIPFGEKSALTLGYEGDYRITSSDAPPPGFGEDFSDRTDHSLFATYTIGLCRYAVVQPFYRFQYTWFTAGQNRNDYLNSFGLGLYCFLTPHISLRTFVGYDIMNSSSKQAPDYNKLDAGGGLNLTIRF